MAEGGRTKFDSLDLPISFDRFLEATEANLFFAPGCDGRLRRDAEKHSVDYFGRFLAVHFTEYGISIVNVGGVGLRRVRPHLSARKRRAECRGTSPPGRLSHRHGRYAKLRAARGGIKVKNGVVMAIGVMMDGLKGLQ